VAHPAQPARSPALHTQRPRLELPPAVAPRGTRAARLPLNSRAAAVAWLGDSHGPVALAYYIFQVGGGSSQLASAYYRQAAEKAAHTWGVR